MSATGMDIVRFRQGGQRCHPRNDQIRNKKGAAFAAPSANLASPLLLLSQACNIVGHGLDFIVG